MRISGISGKCDRVKHELSFDYIYQAVQVTINNTLW